MPIEGPLRELGIHDVFQLLDLSRKTGVLRVTSPLRRNEGTIHFDSGAVVYAEIRSNPHRLGQLLVRSGKVTEADLKRARDMQEAGDPRRLGEILVDLGVITSRELERQVRVQVEEVVFEVMGWREGYFSFNEGPLTDVTPGARVRIPTEALLMEGARRIDEWSRIERKIPHLGVIPALAASTEGQPGELDLLPPEWEVLAVIDGRRDLRAIARVLGRSEFDVAKTVFGLESAGVLGVTDPGTRPRPQEPTADLDAALHRVDALLQQRDLEAARAEAEAAAAAHPGDARAHLALGRVHLVAGRMREAEDEGRRALQLDPLLVGGHRLMGDALVGRGRFREAVEWWNRWLAMNGEARDPADEEQVRSAVEAARVLDGVLRSHRG